MHKLISGMIGLVSLTACTTHAVEANTEKSLVNKAVSVVESIETGDPTAFDYLNPDQYTQHNLMAADGVEGLQKLASQLPKETTKADVVRVFQDDNYVVTHTNYNLFGNKVGFDIFRFEDGKIVEHWDNLTDLTPANPSGHSQTDGPVEIQDIDKTEDNKALVEQFVSRVLIQGDYSAMPEFFNGDAYIQHNSQIGDGLTALTQAFQAMANQGIVLQYDRIHTVLGQGNFVLAVSEGSFNGTPTAYYDLFRVEDNVIAEHWDVVSAIPPKNKWMNDNGKFGF